MRWLKKLALTRQPERADHEQPDGSAPAPIPKFDSYRFDDETLRIVAIGDIHGRIDLLQQIAGRLDTLNGADDKRLVEVYLGDYIDRGGNPKAVIDFLLERRRQRGGDVICLSGNHEYMLLAALESDDDFRAWLAFGGHPTVVSYGVSLAEVKTNPTLTRNALRVAIPEEHLAFLKGLDLSYQKGGFFFVHAGVRPGIPLHHQTQKDMLWIREDFMRSTVDFGAVIVHGHTPVPKPVFRPNRISIDTGAYGSGVLTCLTVASEGIALFDGRQPQAAV